jgi:RNA polymerase sigma factor (sigma-70 family)
MLDKLKTTKGISIEESVSFKTLNTKQITRNSKKSEEQILLQRISQGHHSAFWQIWSNYQNYLYHRCVGWMGGNYIEAEEALSQAALKAWEKLPQHAHKITNLKAWLTRFTHNLCVDLHRQRRRAGVQTQSLEIMAVEDVCAAFNIESPESALLHSELKNYLHQAITALSPRLRTAFILRFYQDMSYQDIANQLAISTVNARKRIQQARESLQKQLHQYLAGDKLLKKFTS